MEGLTQNVEEESFSHVEQMEFKRKASENEASVLSLGCNVTQQKIRGGDMYMSAEGHS